MNPNLATPPTSFPCEPGFNEDDLNTGLQEFSGLYRGCIGLLSKHKTAGAGIRTWGLGFRVVQRFGVRACDLAPGV